MASAKRVFKSTAKLGGGQKVYRKWEEWKEGDILIGKYVDTHEDQYGKHCPVIEVIDAQFKDKSGGKFEGKNLVLNQCGQLEKAMKKAEKSQVLQFTYNGKSRIEKGPYKGKDSHLVETMVVQEEEQDTSDLV